MKKMSTLFKKDPNDLGRVINEIDPKNDWVINGEGIATRKFDGSACAIIDGELYKRYDAKKGKQPPEGAIPCCEPDLITGHHPHWQKCKADNPADKYFFEGYNSLVDLIGGVPEDGTYELIGEKINGNREKIEGRHLMRHGIEILSIWDFSFEGLYKFLLRHDIEGIVFHHKTDGRMCKLRKSDFGIKR